MKYTLICDESSTEQRHMVIGTIIIPTHNYSFLVKEIQDWKESRGFNPQSELKTNHLFK